MDPPGPETTHRRKSTITTKATPVTKNAVAADKVVVEAILSDVMTVEVSEVEVRRAAADNVAEVLREEMGSVVEVRRGMVAMIASSAMEVVIFQLRRLA